ncbi:hypothetical protein DFH07DRAFT_1063048 [Mycena maculata]|uniref:DUF6534 domain-containing protein n=1 Tax=Mycena maculata TaxID=230809 RepID=A0AAD7IPJ3_9AGAR|nr:hypothetical protein DFH07DRAFT_1063048 [Mycena maculata]
MSADPSIPNGVGARTASELYGMFFNYGLMGSLVVQVYHYYGSFPMDRALTKTIVYVLFALELTQTGIMSYFAYTIFGSGYGNISVFNKSALEWFPVCILAGSVQLYYAHRLYSFSGSKIAGGVVTFLAVLQICSGIAQGVISKLVVNRSDLASKPICVTIWLASSALCDVLIAGSMSFYLRQASVISSRMRNTISRLVRYSVETGAITALVAVIQIIVFLAFPAHNFFETPSWTLGKLYSNNLLVLLNARAITVGGRDYVPDSVAIGTINFDPRGGAPDTQLTERRTSNSMRSTTDGVEQISKQGPRRYPSSRTLEVDASTL